MIDQHENQTGTTDEDQAFRDGARQVQQLLDHPFAVGFLAVAGVLILFWLGIGVGETLYGAFDGNAGGAAVFAIILVTAIAAAVAIGAWLDRRDAGDDEGPLTDEQG